MGDPSEESKSKTGQQDQISRADTEDEFVENEKLFEAVMKNKWEEVVKTYKNSPRAREAKLITKSEDTALHIAVSTEQTESALELVDAIDGDVLVRIQNAKGNTPLHLSAMLGNLKLCKEMVKKNPNLIAVRNNYGETPIFLAVLHGQQVIFSYLHQNSVIMEEYLRRDDGDTILHVAVSGEYFSLAMQIIEGHQNLVDAMNEDGLSPLHVLANKPNAFKSSTQLGIFDRFIYYCLFVDTEIKEGEVFDKSKIENYRKRKGGGGDNDNKDYPTNYETCMNFVNILLKRLFLAIIGLDVNNIIKTWVIRLRNKLLNNSSNLHVHEQKQRKKYDDPEDEENPQQKNCKQTGPGVGAASSETVSNKPENDDQANSKKEKSEKTTGEKNSTPKSCLPQYFFEEVKMDAERKRLFPPNYDTLVLFTKFMMKVLLIILGVELHMRANVVMEKLVKHTKFYKSYGNTGSIPARDSRTALVAEDFSLSMLEDDKAQEDPDFNPLKAAQETQKYRTQRGRKKHKGKKKSGKGKRGKAQTPILIAAKNGVTEMVEKILQEFPVAIQDEDAEHKNVALLAIENRQPHVYKFLLKKENIPTESVFRHVDYQGNSALHLAATQCKKYRPWLISGSALQMQWEIKWFQFVKNSLPPNFFHHYNKRNQTPNEVFVNTHKDLIKEGSDWLTKTSESCSVVAALVATVAFATSSTVPGRINEEKGTPTLEEKPAFNAFAISSLTALCFSITALVFFLSILTSRYQEKDFALDLPRKLLLGLTSLFASIASMLVSFCSGHIFVLNSQLRYVAYPLYAALCLPITFFAFAQLSLYFDILLSIFRSVPQRSYEVLAH